MLRCTEPEPGLHRQGSSHVFKTASVPAQDNLLLLPFFLKTSSRHMADTLLFTQNGTPFHCPSLESYLALNPADDNTCNALLSCVNAWADSFSSAEPKETLLMLDEAASSAGGSEASIEHTQPRPAPEMQAPHHSYAMQENGEVLKLSGACSMRTESRGSADATAAGITQDEAPVDTQATGVHVQELARVKDAWDCAETVPLSMAGIAVDADTRSSPTSPGCASPSAVEVNNTVSAAESSVQNDEETNDEENDKDYDIDDDNVNDQHNDIGNNDNNKGNANDDGNVNDQNNDRGKNNDNVDNVENADDENNADNKDNAIRHHPEASDRQGQGQEMPTTDECRDKEGPVQPQPALLSSPTENCTRDVLSAGVELTDQSVHQGGGLAREFRRSLAVTMLALYVVLRGHAITDRKLVEMFQTVDLPGILKCPSLDDIKREEEVQRAPLAHSTCQSAERRSPEIIDLTGDNDIDMDKAQGRAVAIASGRKRSRAKSSSFSQCTQGSPADSGPPAKQPRTSPRHMADGIRIIRSKSLRYKTNKMNHPVSRYLRD